MIVRLEETDLKPLIDAAIPISGLFVTVLAIAIYFLWRSLNKQMTKIDPNLPVGPHERERAEDWALEQEAVARGEQEAQARDQQQRPSGDAS